jgi:hypothetical protein
MDAQIIEFLRENWKLLTIGVMIIFRLWEVKVKLSSKKEDDVLFDMIAAPIYYPLKKFLKSIINKKFPGVLKDESKK